MTAGKQHLMEHICSGEVGHQHTESDGQQKQRLVFFDDSQIEKNERNGYHYQTLPVFALEEMGKAGVVNKVKYSFHCALRA